jgi:flagellar hook assembly protein FlgD
VVILSLSVHLALAEDLPARLEIFDPTGRRVWLWQNPAAGGGRHVVTWDGRNDAGQRVSSGTYYLQFVSAGKSRARSVLLLR